MTQHPDFWLWTIFILVTIILLIVDLLVLNRKAHEIKIRESLLLCVYWIVPALLFNALVYYVKGHEAGNQFLTGYIIEKALSVDNLFVFLLIFSFFNVKPKNRHGVLYWGILGAVVFRAFFIGAGLALITRFEWVIYIFGAFLLYTGIKMLKKGDEEIHPERNPILLFIRKHLPLTKDYVGDKFFTRVDGKILATPLVIVLIAIESTDVVFAVDSIPAILSITRDGFIAFSSNIFAVLGLRALFFALAGLMPLFRFLHYGLAAILVFIGFKMLIHHWFVFPIGWALAVVVLTLGLSIILSLLIPETEKSALEKEVDEALKKGE